MQAAFSSVNCGLNPNPSLEKKLFWAEGRSACELARAWCGKGSVSIPAEVRAILDSRAETQGTVLMGAEPECRLYFDQLGGEPRNADLGLATLRAAPGFGFVPPAQPELHLLHRRLDSWRGVDLARASSTGSSCTTSAPACPLTTADTAPSRSAGSRASTG